MCPPMLELRSTTRTFKPWSARSSADCSPAMPPPTMSASGVYSELIWVFIAGLPAWPQQNYGKRAEAWRRPSDSQAQPLGQLRVHRAEPLKVIAQQRDLLEKCLDAHGADGGQADALEAQSASAHARSETIDARRQSVICAMIGTIGAAGCNQNAVDSLCVGLEIEILGKEHRRKHPQNIHIGGILQMRLADRIGARIGALLRRQNQYLRNE